MTETVETYEDDLDRGLRNVELAVRAVQRAFGEIGRCNDLLDRAQETGGEVARELEALLRQRDRGAVLAVLDRLGVLAAEVARSEADRAVVTRILDGEDDGIGDDLDDWSVPTLAEHDLPRVPTVHDAESPRDVTLEDMWERDRALTAERQHVGQERIRITSEHLRTVVGRAVESFGTPDATAELLSEARRAYILWASCVR
ncbi:hypothetical protein ACFYU9_20615 [Streptomyces sp. NPDC004327]|uniref:hypothetical protein n=1 Tax=Streptomyces sp. NPDC004327 TaxID=3364699 RepID=UPI0036AEAAAC